MILVAVSLDPFHVQEATIEVPLWEWKLPDNGAVTVQDLMRDTTSSGTASCNASASTRMILPSRSGALRRA